MILLFVVVAALAGLWLFSRAVVFLIERRWPPIGSVMRVDGLGVHVVDLPARTDVDLPAHADVPALLLIHGASGNLREPLAALGEALGGRFRLIAIDRPGNGYTSRGGPEMSDPARQADLIAEALRKLDATSCLVVGHSWGAAVAAALALGHPRFVHGLVLVAPATHPWPGGGVSRRLRLFALPYLGRVLAELVVVPLALSIIRRMIRLIFDPDPVPPGFIDRIGALLAIRPRSYIANCRDIAQLYRHVTRLSPRYREIGAPTEIVAGESDRIVSPHFHGRALARDIPDARLTILRGAGHMPHWSHTGEVAAAIDRVSRRAAELRRPHVLHPRFPTPHPVR